MNSSSTHRNLFFKQKGPWGPFLCYTRARARTLNICALSFPAPPTCVIISLSTNKLKEIDHEELYRQDQEV